MHTANSSNIWRFISTVALALVIAASDSLAVDYRNPAEIKPLLEQLMQQPQASAGPTTNFYAINVNHFDGLIPFSSLLVKTWDEAKPHYKYTCQDGLIIKCERRDGAGDTSDYFAVWYNAAGAPVVSTHIIPTQRPSWYEYAVYAPSGKIRAAYRFNNAFDLVFYREYVYGTNSTSIRYFNRDGSPDMETLYENGQVFSIKDGQRTFLPGDRTQEVYSCVRFGLKPFFPGVDPPPARLHQLPRATGLRPRLQAQ